MTSGIQLLVAMRRGNLDLGLAAVSAGNPADNCSAHGAGRENWGHGLGDDGVREAQQESEAEARDKRAEHRGALVRKTQGNHQRNVNTTEDQPAEYAKRNP